MKMKLDKNDPHLLHTAFLNVMLRIHDIEKKKIKTSQLDITPKELSHIVMIASYPHLKQSDMLDFLDITKGTYSTMIASLSRKGFISQVNDLHDKRVKRLVIEKQGVKALELNAQIRAHIRDEIITKVSEKEWNDLIDLAMKLGHHDQSEEKS